MKEALSNKLIVWPILGVLIGLALNRVSVYAGST